MKSRPPKPAAHGDKRHPEPEPTGPGLDTNTGQFHGRSGPGPEHLDGILDGAPDGIFTVSWTLDRWAVCPGMEDQCSCRRSRRRPLEFRREAVRLLRISGRSVPQLAKELGGARRNCPGTGRASSTSMRARPRVGPATSREELRRLRREVRTLTEERDTCTGCLWRARPRIAPPMRSRRSGRGQPALAAPRARVGTATDAAGAVGAHRMGGNTRPRAR